jgi:hypothetical protein
MSKLDELEPVEVWWMDAHGGAFPTKEWGEIGEKHLHGETIRTVGLLYSQTKDGLLLLLSMSNRGNVDAYIFIPRGCITEITYLEDK